MKNKTHPIYLLTLLFLLGVTLVAFSAETFDSRTEVANQHPYYNVEYLGMYSGARVNLYQFDFGPTPSNLSEVKTTTTVINLQGPDWKWEKAALFITSSTMPRETAGYLTQTAGATDYVYVAVSPYAIESSTDAVQFVTGAITVTADTGMKAAGLAQEASGVWRSYGLRSFNLNGNKAMILGARITGATVRVILRLSE